MYTSRNNEEAIIHAESLHSKDCFLQNAFLFLDNAERIMGDPRMSMARVSVSNGLAYMGAFPTATLGTYLDWWLNSGLEEILHDKEEQKALTWHIGGSPLTGMNSCACVYPDGTAATISHGSFARVWKTFADAIKRNRNEEEPAEVFSIEEVAEVLKTNATTEEEILRARLAVQQRANRRLTDGLNQLFEKHQEVSTRYEKACLRHHKDELSAYSADLLRFSTETSKKLQEVALEVAASRKDFREGKKSKEDHTRLLKELNKRRSEIEQQLAEFKNERIAQLTADGELTERIIESYLTTRPSL